MTTIVSKEEVARLTPEQQTELAKAMIQAEKRRKEALKRMSKRSIGEWVGLDILFICPQMILMVWIGWPRRQPSSGPMGNVWLDVGAIGVCFLMDMAFILVVNGIHKRIDAVAAWLEEEERKKVEGSE